MVLVLEMSDKKIIGFCISEKKSQKWNWEEFSSKCDKYGYKLVKLDLKKPIQCQGPFDVLILKLKDILPAAEQGDEKAKRIINQLEFYISEHPEMVILDPLDNVRILVDRHRYYSLLQGHQPLQKHSVFIPKFVELTSTDLAKNVLTMKQNGLRFPVLCKSSVASGSRTMHTMSLIFNVRGLLQCRPPCVLQNYVNHNAVLYKIYVMGERYTISKRPSLKNFHECEKREPIHFYSGDVCKPDSTSHLSVLDGEPEISGFPLDESRIRKIIKILKEKLNMSFMGFDVVIDNTDGRYAIIDVNVFPNYPDFFENVLICVDGALREKAARMSRIG